MKKTFLTLCALALATAAHAQSFAAYIYQGGVLKGKYVLAEKPVLAFADEDLVVKVGGEQQFQFTALGTVVKFQEESTGIHAVQDGKAGADGKSAPVFSLKDGSLNVAGLVPGETLRLYSTDGRLTGVSHAKEDGTASANLGKGVTLVQAGTFTFKILNK